MTRCPPPGGDGCGLAPLPFPTAPVRVLENPGPHDVVGQQEPFVIRGWLDQWPLYRELEARTDLDGKLAFLSALDPEATVQYTSVPTRGRMGYRPGSLEPNFAYNQTTGRWSTMLGEMGAHLRGERSEPCYLQSLPVAARLPAFLPLLGGSPGGLLPSGAGRLWLGSGSHVVNLHYDIFSNFACLFAGTKRVTLFPPEALPKLYPAPPDRGLALAPCSLVDLLAPDLHGFPLLSEAFPSALSVVLAPGDTLHIPPCWWHHVESQGFNLMINFWSCTFSVVWRRLLSRGLEDLLLSQDDLAPELRPFLHDLLKDGLRSSEAPELRQVGRSRAYLPGEIRSQAASFLDVLAVCPPYLARLFRSFAEHYSRANPFPTLPGAREAFLDRMRGKRRQGEALLCF